MEVRAGIGNGDSERNILCPTDWEGEEHGEIQGTSYVYSEGK